MANSNISSTPNSLEMPVVMVRLTEREIQALADRLFSRGISVLSLDQREVRTDLVVASRVLRALLRNYENRVGSPLNVVLVAGGDL